MRFRYSALRVLAEHGEVRHAHLGVRECDKIHAGVREAPEQAD
jgi:hypothetical protein